MVKSLQTLHNKIRKKKRRQQLSTLDLRDAFKNDDNFIGVFAINRLPQDVKNLPIIKMIANLDTHNLPGRHWVAFLVQDGVGFYFDSYGDFPPMEAQHWLAKNTSKWEYYTQAVQASSDKVSCGYLCINFLKLAAS